jgi:L-gulonolactone oxidase
MRADGALVDVDAADPALFAAARVGLGALGVIATVTLRCEPAFALAASEAPASLDAVLAELDALVDGNDHFEFCWIPHTRRVLAKRANRVLPGVALRPLRRVRRYVDDDLLANTAVEAVSRLTTRRPGLIPRANAVAARVLTARDHIDRSDRVFAVPRKVVFREMEYALARADVPAVLAEIADYLDRSGEQVGLPVHVRFAAADDIWLSPAQGRITGYVAVRQYHRRPHESYFQAVAAIARAMGGRPHWGKIHDQDADSLRASYPHFDDFRAVRDRVDPTRVFGNDYLTRVLGP